MIELDNYNDLCKVVIRDYPTFSGLMLEKYFRQTDGGRGIPRNGLLVGA